MAGHRFRKYAHRLRPGLFAPWRAPPLQKPPACATRGLQEIAQRGKPWQRCFVTERQCKSKAGYPTIAVRSTRGDAGGNGLHLVLVQRRMPLPEALPRGPPKMDFQKSKFSVCRKSKNAVACVLRSASAFSVGARRVVRTRPWVQSLRGTRVPSYTAHRGTLFDAALERAGPGARFARSVHVRVTPSLPPTLPRAPTTRKSPRQAGGRAFLSIIPPP